MSGTHPNQGPSRGGIHVIHNWEYTDAANRAAHIPSAGSTAPLAPEDIGKIALQLDNWTYWSLQDDSPITWVDLTGATYTDEQAQDAVGTILTDTATIDFTYSDATPSITAIVIDDSITNAKLANMATARFKGRTTAGTGDPEDLTGTQATALLDNFVGDSGSGGTKGLVLAPASGDAAANRYLKATGAWATPTATEVGAPTTAAFDDHSARHENGGADEISVGGLSGQLADAQPVTVRKNSGSDTGTRPRLNFIEGSNVSLTIADDGGDSEIDITIASTGYTDEQAQDAVGTILTDTATIDFTYSDATPSITADVIDDSITNAKLANMATARFKGRTTAGTGDPEDLTGTQATALLDNFVGDSGSGGTKGLVLAPASGDAAANKYLKASGAWATPTATEVGAPTTAAFNDHSARHEDGGADEISVAGLSGQLADPQPVTVRKNSGANVGSRTRLNFIEGSNITLTIADDGADSEVDITIASTGGYTDEQAQDAVGTILTDTATIDFTYNDGTPSITADVINASITNAKLANMATARFKGRTTAGTGDPEDLTGTQATALLDNVVGDSGSGGTKGLVPAPASGDAAAGKYLEADGTWKPVPSSVQRSFRPLIQVSPGATFTPTDGTTYACFVGYMTAATLIKFVEFVCLVNGSSTQIAEVALGSTPSYPNKANQTITVLVADGTLDSLTAGAGLTRRNTTAFSSGAGYTVARGTYLWALIRTAMAGTEPGLGSAGGDLSQGHILSATGVGALTSATTFTGNIIASALGTIPFLSAVTD